MKRVVKPYRTVLHSVVTGLCLLLSLHAKPAEAYEEDTHYHMTYILCRAVGFTEAEARTVARFDQGMDDSAATSATTGPGDTQPQIIEEILWHAIPALSKPAEVLLRKEALFQEALAEPNPLSSLMRLGVFFHYQQDTWAHRNHPNQSDVSFEPFTVPLGHAVQGHQPDRPPFDPPCALRCLEDGIQYARRYLTTRLGGTPNPLFDNYKPRPAEVQQNWNDPRKGKFFNQLAPMVIDLPDLDDDSIFAPGFLMDLIRAQIDAYTTSKDFNPNWFGEFTADKATEARLRPRLQAVIDAEQMPFKVPSRLPMSFLTTPMLLTKSPPLSQRAGPPGVDLMLFPSTGEFVPVPVPMTEYTVRIHTGDRQSAGTNSNIFLSIIGRFEVSSFSFGSASYDGPLDEQRLNWQIAGDAFERNQTDTCVLERLPVLKEIRGVTIRSDGTRAAAGWFLDWVEISAPHMGTKRFNYGNWVESGKLTVTLDR